MPLGELPLVWRDDPQKFGAALVGEMREPVRPDDDERPWATGLLRWGAEVVDDDLLFSAVVAACGHVSGWSERWLLSDGVVAESINARPAVRERWLAECGVNPIVHAVEAVEDIPDK
jgi:hypothetical protein